MKTKLIMKMNIKNLIIIIFLIFFSSNILFSQDFISLNDAIKIVLENNYEIKIAENDLQITKNNVSYGNAGFLPSLDVTGSLNNAVQNVKQEYLDGREVNRDGAKTSGLEGAVGLNWTIFDGLKMFINYDRLKELNKIGELQFKAKVENTIRDVSILYFTAVNDLKQLEITGENLSISRTRYDFIKNKFDVGTASKFELLQANVDLNADISDSIDKKNTYDNSLVELKRFMNYGFEKEISLDNNLNFDSNLSIEEQIDKIDNNIDVQITKQSIEINKYDIRAIKSDYYPSISFYGNYGFSQQTAEAGFLSKSSANGLNYGLTLSMNLFDGFRTNLQAQNAEVNLLTTEYMLKNLKDIIKSAIITTSNDYIKFKDLISFEQDNVESARENMDLALESLNIGLISPVEFRESQRQLTSAQLRLILAEYSAKTSEIELKKLTGSIINN